MDTVNSVTHGLAFTYLALVLSRVTILLIGRLRGQFKRFGRLYSHQHIHMQSLNSPLEPNHHQEQEFSHPQLQGDEDNDHLFIHFALCFGFPFRNSPSSSSFMNFFVTSYRLSLLQISVWIATFISNIFGLLASASDFFSKNQTITIFNFGSSFSTQLLLTALWSASVINITRIAYKDTDKLLYALSTSMARRACIAVVTAASTLSLVRSIVSSTIEETSQSQTALVDYAFHLILSLQVCCYFLISLKMKEFMNPLFKILQPQLSLPVQSTPHDALRAFLKAKESIVKVCLIWQPAVTCLIIGLTANSLDFAVMLLTDATNLLNNLPELYFLSVSNLIVMIILLMSLRIPSQSYTKYVIGANWSAVETKWSELITFPVINSMGEFMSSERSARSMGTGRSEVSSNVSFQDIVQVTQMLTVIPLSANLYGFQINNEAAVKTLATLFSVFFALYKVTDTFK